MSNGVDTRDPEELLDVARGWSFWEAAPRRTVPREVTLPKALEPGIALMIQGVRR